MDGLDIRTTPFSYYKDSTFFIGNKGRTAINPNIFIYVLDGLIGLFTGWRSVFDLPKTCEKSLLAEIRTLHCSKTPSDAYEKVLSRGGVALLFCYSPETCVSSAISNFYLAARCYLQPKMLNLGIKTT